MKVRAGLVLSGGLTQAVHMRTSWTSLLSSDGDEGTTARPQTTDGLNRGLVRLGRKTSFPS